MGKSQIEKVVLGASLALLGASGVEAAHKRRLDMKRRADLKGTGLVEVPEGNIEYQLYGDPTSKPVAVLENGLGQPLEGWSWVAQEMTSDWAVLVYHRPGYGRTTYRGTPTQALETLMTQLKLPEPQVMMAHSIGAIFLAQHLQQSWLTGSKCVAVIIDGTYPKLLETDRDDSRRVGKFTQLQVHTLLAGLMGFYFWGPTPVERQMALEPDLQFASTQFSYSPRTVKTATREYLSVSLDTVEEVLKCHPNLLVLGSDENGPQQEEFAKALSAHYSQLGGSSHRTILGFRNYALRVVEEVSNYVLSADIA